jgi:HSP20 family protein
MTFYISPARRLTNLREAVDRAMEETIADISPREREMTLAVDVRATDDGYKVRALIPGVSTDDLNIEILNNTVAIRGEFPAESDEENTRYLTCELPTGRFARVLTLPTAVDAARSEASLKNGVLSLWIPKAEAFKPKTIKINQN